MGDFTKEQIDAAFLLLYKSASDYVKKLNPEEIQKLLAYAIANAQMTAYLQSTIDENIRAAFDSHDRVTEFAEKTIREHVQMIDGLWELLQKAPTKERSRFGKSAAKIRHSKEGGSNSKRDAIRTIWASGKYSSRDVCAEQECAALGMSFSSARKALRNMPPPHLAATSKG